ncbi:MAG TPA: hypothetical protein VEQ60_10530, partial [Longimicrobium sp.]|nr:hypothetical protein [Longimicrobium sp.]
MRIYRPPARVLCAALLALPLGLLSTRAQAQITCTTRIDCVEKGIPFTNQSPGVAFRFLPDTVYEANQKLDIFVYDAGGLDEHSRTLTATGATVLTGPAWRWNKPIISASMTGSVLLALGNNVVTAHVCDLTGRCTDAVQQVVYALPPPGASRVAPVVRNALDPARRVAATCDGCADAVLTYSTPAYQSLDQPHGVTLMYARAQASPRGYVEVEVADNSPEQPVRMSLQVMHPAGHAVTPEIFYQGGGGSRTMAAQWDAGSYGTGALVHTAVVRSYWDSGAPLQATVPVRVIVVDERQSRFGAGWSMVGLQHVYAQSDGALITHGDGSAVFFARTGTSYQSPAGETSTLAYDDATATYTRLYPDGSQAIFGGGGYLYHQQDRLGSRTSYQWISNYQGVPVPYRITDPAGQVLVMDYHTAQGPHYGKLASVTDPGGRITYFGYWDGWENLTNVQDAAGGAALQAQYDAAAHVLTSWTDRRGGAWNVSYDHAGRLSAVLAPAVTDGGVTARATTTIRSRHAAMLPLPGTGTLGALARRVTADSAVVVVASAADSVRILADARGLATRV